MYPCMYSCVYSKYLYLMYVYHAWRINNWGYCTNSGYPNYFSRCYWRLKISSHLHFDYSHPVKCCCVNGYDDDIFNLCWNTKLLSFHVIEWDETLVLLGLLLWRVMYLFSWLLLLFESFIDRLHIIMMIWFNWQNLNASLATTKELSSRQMEKSRIEVSSSFYITLSLKMMIKVGILTSDWLVSILYY